MSVELGTESTSIIDVASGNALTVSVSGAAKIDGSAVTQPISAASLPLPTGAATSANQSTMITSLSNIDAGIPTALGQTTMSASMPIVIASDQSAVSVLPVPIGSQANAWNAATVASGANSSVVDCQYARTVTIFGNVAANMNPLRIQASIDNTNFYTITTISIATGNWGTTLDFGARYVRLQAGQAGTITATVAGK